MKPCEGGGYVLTEDEITVASGMMAAFKPAFSADFNNLERRWSDDVPVLAVPGPDLSQHMLDAVQLGYESGAVPRALRHTAHDMLVDAGKRRATAGYFLRRAVHWLEEEIASVD